MSEKSRNNKWKDHKPSRTVRGRRVTSQEVFSLLEAEYGSVKWSPRYDPIAELVFTILSQHTSDVNAERAFLELQRACDSWHAVAEADLETITKAIRGAGLAQQKAPRIRNTLQKIQELRGALRLDFLADLPLEEAKRWLRQLPGVGPKTAAVVLCFALGMPALPVDTHIHRVSRRLGLIGPQVTAEQAHDLLEEKVPAERVFPFHVYMITHGRRVCKALRPRCEACVLNQRCPSSLA